MKGWCFGVPKTISKHMHKTPEGVPKVPKYHDCPPVKTNCHPILIQLNFLNGGRHAYEKGCILQVHGQENAPYPKSAPCACNCLNWCTPWPCSLEEASKVLLCWHNMWLGASNEWLRGLGRLGPHNKELHDHARGAFSCPFLKQIPILNAVTPTT